MKNKWRTIFSIIVAILIVVIISVITASPGADRLSYYLGIILTLIIIFGISYWLFGKIMNSQNPTHRDKSPNQINESTKEQIAHVTEERLRKAVIRHREESPLKGTAIEGMTLMKAINGYAESFKENLISGKDRIGLTESKINEIIENSKSKILDEFIEI